MYSRHQNIPLNTLRKFSTYFTENTLSVSDNTRSALNIKAVCLCNEHPALNLLISNFRLVLNVVCVMHVKFTYVFVLDRNFEILIL